MKKGFILLFFLLFVSSNLLFTQSIDSFTIQQELQRLNQIEDSLANSKDNLLLENGGVSMPFEPGTGDEVLDEKQANFDKFIELQKKEQNIFRNKILLLVAGVAIILIWMRTVIYKQDQKKQRRNNTNPSA